ncbi:hypothetical protein SODALDRAFT_270007 [Sodiomyces alkalinus F11]|uniref:SAC3/GANP/THP3 conserved domain-containing protein n=1 Tax=Sodiomyces alkalinus (strain CBS 110278 / VKM F-3762 / F11) TaxID=1314773 RepID=A0A3N2Q7Z7_SODAK|nr:hypothetical protein SODALDRAFT_270007 [Sodiomyces alkalinus F11]ROT42893.1 hypothetical protein SODALDRAFT_270007 [Sodiomyces alkalinus F11]
MPHASSRLASPPPPDSRLLSSPSAHDSLSAPAYTPVQVRQGFGQYPHVPSSTNSLGPFAPAPIPAQVNQNANVPPNPTPMDGTPSAPPPKGKVSFSDAVRNYVRRAFLPANLDPTIRRQDIEAKLKETISYAADNGLLDSTDWDAMPLPVELIKKDLLARLNMPHPHPGPISPVGSNGSASKKRKSSDRAEVAAVPWRSTNARTSSLEDRITHPPADNRPAVDEPLPKSSKFQKQMEKRQRRWGNYQSAPRSPTPPPTMGPVVGTCEVLEKRYLRLTSAPVPSQVRPEHVLHKTVELLKKKWRKENNYSYICDQLKSVRQDLTVQRIKNNFTVSVYELHARIALEKGDLGEYNQCQTQLRSLYGLGLAGNPIEFKAYRILYFIHTANRTGLSDALADLTPAEKRELPIKHALHVRTALALGNYHRFFRLYLDTPNMGAYLMDMFVVRERLAALCNICKAYKPDVKLRFITEELGFESDHDAAQFIVDYNGQHLLEERGEHIALLTGKAGALFESARAAAFRRVDIKGQI